MTMQRRQQLLEERRHVVDHLREASTDSVARFFARGRLMQIDADLILLAHQPGKGT